MLSIESGVSTITDILTAALSPVGTPWAYLSDTSGDPTTTVLLAHSVDIVSNYPAYIAGSDSPHVYDGNRNFLAETDLKDYNPIFDLMVAIKTFGVQTKTSDFSFLFSWTLVF